MRRVEGEFRGVGQGEMAGMKVVMGRGDRRLVRTDRFLGRI